MDQHCPCYVHKNIYNENLFYRNSIMKIKAEYVKNKYLNTLPYN